MTLEKYMPTGKPRQSNLSFEINKTHCIDCRKALSQMPARCVAITMTSPPYNLGNPLLWHTDRKDKYDGAYKDKMSDEQYYQFLKKVVMELLRVTKYYVFFNFQPLSNNMPSFLRLLAHFRPYIKEFFVWAKPNPIPATQKNCFAAGFEFILCLSKWDNKGRTFKRAFLNRRPKQPIAEVSNTIIKTFNKKFVEGHLAGFPLWLPKFFIERFTQKDEIVLDPFMGTGTTGKAALQLGRKYLGFEISEEYCETAQQRCDALFFDD